MVSILNECGLILERRRFREEKQAIELETQQERLRIESAESDFPTTCGPLTSISGNAGVLMKRTSCWMKKKQEQHRSIYDDSMWLVNLTENLLSITRIENGTMHLQMGAELMDDVFQEAWLMWTGRPRIAHISVELPTICCWAADGCPPDCPGNY